MKTISKEVASQGVRINTLSPSMIKTPMTDLTDLNGQYKALYEMQFKKQEQAT